MFWREARFWAVMIALAPVIAWQGKQVRRTTPRLPEPPGLRLHWPDERSVSLLVVGDSAAAGVGASDQSEALLGQLLERLPCQGDEEAGFCLLANTGDTAQDVIGKLDQIPDAQFDWVVVSVGVNDVTGFTSLKRWRQQFAPLAASTLSARISAVYRCASHASLSGFASAFARVAGLARPAVESGAAGNPGRARGAGG